MIYSCLIVFVYLCLFLLFYFLLFSLFVSSIVLFMFIPLFVFMFIPLFVYVYFLHLLDERHEKRRLCFQFPIHDKRKHQIQIERQRRLLFAMHFRRESANDHILMLNFFNNKNKIK